MDRSCTRLRASGTHLLMSYEPTNPPPTARIQHSVGEHHQSPRKPSSRPFQYFGRSSRLDALATSLTAVQFHGATALSAVIPMQQNCGQLELRHNTAGALQSDSCPVPQTHVQPSPLFDPRRWNLARRRRRLTPRAALCACLLHHHWVEAALGGCTTSGWLPEGCW